MVLGPLNIHIQKNKIRPLLHSIYTKLTQHVSAKIIKLIGKNKDVYLCDWIWQWFLGEKQINWIHQDSEKASYRIGENT